MTVRCLFYKNNRMALLLMMSVLFLGPALVDKYYSSKNKCCGNYFCQFRRSMPSNMLTIVAMRGCI